MGNPLATIDIDQKEGSCCAFGGGGVGSPSNTMWPGPTPISVPSGILIDPPSRLATTDMNRKLGGGCCVLFLGSWSPITHLTQYVTWAEAYLCTKWHRHGPKIGGCARGGRGLGPHLTQCDQGRGWPPRQVSSWSIQPFGHNTPTLQTDRQTGQTDRQRSDSIGWTVLQTVAQKMVAMATTLRHLISTIFFSDS